ncbi:hypothetical protein [Roseibacillus persicicus]|uniref:hypothetical protein n=1 Tax=Roseibacillus persicicus TaxID=454148 RepID=UPI00280DE81F|nr:hypothetical protein [Roseibacillus persicicus]MDQ8192653.1 hypothetical protein [Roseibacillus persicicus]
MQISQFDAVSFFGQFNSESGPMNHAQLQPILEFTLLWNLFERELGNRSMSLKTIKNIVDICESRGDLDSLDVDPYVEFFRDRYPRFSEEGFLAQRLEPMAFREGGRTMNNVNLFRKVLDGELVDRPNVVYSLLFVAYRMRNNLFHGEKDISLLHLQEDLFNAMNTFISKFLVATVRQISEQCAAPQI